MSNDWTDKISKRLEDHQLDGFGGKWTEIEAAVAQAKADQRRRQARTAWIRRSAIAAVAAAAAVAAVVWLPTGTTTTSVTSTAPIATGKAIAQAKSAVNPAASATSPLATAPTPPSAAATLPSSSAATSSTNDQASAQPQAAASQPVLLAQSTETETESTPQAASSKPEESTPARTDEPMLAAAATSNEQKQAETAPTAKRGKNATWAYDVSNAPIKFAASDEPDRWAVGIFASNSPAKIGGNSDILDSYTNAGPGSGTGSDEYRIEPSINVASLELHHKQPISVGATVRYQLSRRWSVEAGLAYTYLNADYSNSYLNCEQRLHYLGIPVKVNFDLYSSKRINVYVTAGGMAEKLVSGRFNGYYTKTGGNETHTAIREGGLQWSVKGAAGIAFNITRDWAIYAEPGVGHYFSNGSSVQNFYKESPTCFNLLVGLRFSTGR